MPKKRRKKYKIRAAERRSRQLSANQELGLGLKSVISQVSNSGTTRASAPASAQLRLQESLLGFNLDLIKQDLIKTMLVSSVIIVLVLALFVWL